MTFWNRSWTWENSVATGVMAIVFWTLVVWVAVIVLRSLRRRPESSPGTDPQRILD